MSNNEPTAVPIDSAAAPSASAASFAASGNNQASGDFTAAPARRTNSARRRSLLRRADPSSSAASASAASASAAASPEGGVVAPVRSKSWLQRMGIAPLDIAGGNATAGQHDANNLPDRSPEGAIRLPSGLTIRQPSKTELGNAFKQSSQLNQVKAAAAPKVGTTGQPIVTEGGVKWHLISDAELATQLSTHTDTGLSSEEAKHILSVVGPNQISQPPRISVLERFFINFTSAFSIIMIVAAILCFIIFAILTAQQGAFDVQDFALAIVLIGVSVITSSFQTYMENASDNLMEELNKLTAPNAWVFRDGHLTQIPAAELVPGDRVRVTQGDKVPGDLRLLEVNALKVNNSSLTGETMDINLNTHPAPTVTDPKQLEQLPIEEARNIAFSGCNFTGGNGIGIVFATGDHTAFGRIAKSAVTAERPDTLMRREVRRLVLIMSSIGSVMALAFLGAAFGLNRGWTYAILAMIAMFVANVPEGLLPQITLALTITAQRMQERQVAVSNLEIIETLGAVSVICSDKTGTLTLNQMSLSHVVVGGVMYSTARTPLQPGDVPNPIEEAITVAGSPAQAAHPLILRCLALGSDAKFTRRSDPSIDKWEVVGDATETGMIKYHQAFSDLDAARAAAPRVAVLPFSSSNKFMLSINKLGPCRQLLVMKGAAERVLKRCSTILGADGVSRSKLDADAKRGIEAQISDLAARAERVLAFAELEMSFPDEFEFDTTGDIPNFPMEGLTLLGLVSLVDPVRPTVPGAVRDCHRAGIAVVMITGDHPETARAIAKSIGLIKLPLLPGWEPGQGFVFEDEPAGDAPKAAPKESGEHGCTGEPDDEEDIPVHQRNLVDYSAVVTGDQITKMTEGDWDVIMKCREHVFARTQPEQKQLIVKHFQKLGHIAAMTGDGVNDAPALKAANVGVAMGSGTTVAKESAQITLLKDDFTSIVVGVKEGRQIFENLKKAVVFVISHLAAEMFGFVFNFAIGLPLAMETIVILLIDLGTDMAPGISLAYEEAEDRVMTLPPRGPNDHLIVPRMVVMGYVFTGLFETFFCFWAFIYTFYQYGYTFYTIQGADSGYRGAYGDLTSDYQTFYTNLCSNNTVYVNSVSPTGNATAACGTAAAMDTFLGSFQDTLGCAQGAYFLTLAIFQFGHAFMRRQQVTSTFHPDYIFSNWRNLASIFFSVAICCFFVYVPVVNNAFFLRQTQPAHALSGCWGVPLLWLFEEIRKYYCRNYPKGWMARNTLY